MPRKGTNGGIDEGDIMVKRVVIGNFILVLSGVLSSICDEYGLITEPALFWLIGTICGMASQMIIYWKGEAA